MLDDEALYGLAGDVVRQIEPHTEGDAFALLVQLLVGFGNVIGRKAHFVVEQTRHYLKLFAVLVGDTSKGRKGTSWDHVYRLLAATDANWAEGRILAGLTSGEGLTWAVRDPIEKSEPMREKGGRIVGYQTVIVDDGIKDKRLLVLETEFASVLKVAERDGSTLSATIRQAWDSGDLRILTKNSPTRATGAHISILGHITRNELLRYLSGTEAANGFANRFLWACVKRSKRLPEGGDLQSVDFAPIIKRLRAAVEFSQAANELRRDEQARALWAAVYPSLSDGKPGLFGTVTSRSEAQTMRLACLYALLDRSAIISAKHLQAALALWQYCEDSARYIFGAATGDRIADRISGALRAKPEGMTRSEITRDLFQRNVSGETVDAALTMLLRHNLITSTPEDTGGRQAERFRIRH